MILEYLKKCEELKEEKINILLRALSKSKVTEISQQKLFTLTSSHFFTPSGIRTFLNPEGKRMED